MTCETRFTVVSWSDISKYNFFQGSADWSGVIRMTSLVFVGFWKPQDRKQATTPSTCPRRNGSCRNAIIVSKWTKMFHRTSAERISEAEHGDAKYARVVEERWLKFYLIRRRMFLFESDTFEVKSFSLRCSANHYAAGRGGGGCYRGRGDSNFPFWKWSLFSRD